MIGWIIIGMLAGISLMLIVSCLYMEHTIRQDERREWEDQDQK